MSSRKAYRNDNINNKTSKKIDEVREVIQNRPNGEIKKVLEYFDFDVGKTINAFVEDQVKTILNSKSKLNQHEELLNENLDKNNNNNNNHLNDSASTQTTTTVKQEKSKKQSTNTSNDLKNKKNNNLFKQFNINDLVDSVINKYTTNVPLAAPPPLPTTTTTSHLSLSPSAIIITTNDLNNCLSSSSSSSNLLLNLNEKRPISLDLDNDNSKDMVNLTNPKKSLEKSQKDLQRQIISLNKLTINFDEEIENSEKELQNVFNRLKQLLSERELNLQLKLNQIKTHGHELLSNRQKKANDLKHSIDSVQHMDELKLQELRADIKHFVSERKLDEELGLTKRFNYDYNHIKETIDTFGKLNEIANLYSTQRPAIHELISCQSEECLTPLLLTKQQNISNQIANNNNTNEIVDKFANNLKLNSNGLNGFNESKTKVNGNHINEFVEIKKPQRIKPNKQQQQPQQQQLEVNNFKNGDRVVKRETNNNYYQTNVRNNGYATVNGGSNGNGGDYYKPSNNNNNFNKPRLQNNGGNYYQQNGDSYSKVKPHLNGQQTAKTTPLLSSKLNGSS